MKKIILIGTGSMSRIYATLISERTDSVLVGVVGNSKYSTENFAKEFSCSPYFSGDIKSALGEHPDCDGIILATVEWVRREYLEQLLPTKIPILIEKPVVTNVKDLEFIKESSMECADLISVIHSLRLSPRFSSAKLSVEAGELGQIRHMRANRNPSLDSVKRVLGKFPLAYWITCHDLDLMRWYANSEAKSVYARSKSKLKSEDDYLIAHVNFGNGIDAVEEVSWCSPSISSVASNCNFTIKGTSGVLEINDNEQNLSIFKSNNVITSPDTYEFLKIGNFHYGLFHTVIDHWVQSMHGVHKNRLTLDNAIKAIQLCRLVELSIERGEVVYAEEA